MTKREAAQANFSKGYNCCQAVLVAFREELGMTEEQAARLGSGMGGGVARLRELCGAVSAMALVAGYCRGYSLPDDQANKARTYAQVRGLIEAFGQAHGATLCRELLADIPTAPGPDPEPRSPRYYAQRPCLALVGDAAARLEAFLAETGPSQD